jgi:hypothetical protein
MSFYEIYQSDMASFIKMSLAILSGKKYQQQGLTKGTE